MNKNLLNLIEKMKQNDLKQILVSNPTDIFYLTGEHIHPGERFLGFLVKTDEKSAFFVNELFPVKNSENYEIIYYSDTQNPIKILLERVNTKALLGIDKFLFSGFLIEILNNFEQEKIINSSFLIENLRMIKTEEEIKLMRASSVDNDKAIKKVIDLVSEMLTEKQLVRAIHGIFDDMGTQGISFDPIIAYGANASSPHHVPGNFRIKHGDSVIIDMGCIKNNYCSDMTRTVFFGAPDNEMKKVYETVLKANLKAIETVKPGVKFSEIDNAARSVIEEAGYGKYFTHRTGHSIGIDVHESPYVSSSNNEKAEKGMIFSIEPGIYLPEKGGVRIEDLVLVTENGVEVLNGYTKEMQII
jgi:Xaa-Pro dipeptidase